MPIQFPYANVTEPHPFLRIAILSSKSVTQRPGTRNPTADQRKTFANRNNSMPLVLKYCRVIRNSCKAAFKLAISRDGLNQKTTFPAASGATLSRLDKVGFRLFFTKASTTRPALHRSSNQGSRQAATPTSRLSRYPEILPTWPDPPC